MNNLLQISAAADHLLVFQAFLLTHWNTSFGSTIFIKAQDVDKIHYHNLPNSIFNLSTPEKYHKHVRGHTCHCQSKSFRTMEKSCFGIHFFSEEETSFLRKFFPYKTTTSHIFQNSKNKSDFTPCPAPVNTCLHWVLSPKSSNLLWWLKLK